jgi:hypothetical protein
MMIRPGEDRDSLSGQAEEPPPRGFARMDPDKRRYRLES